MASIGAFDVDFVTASGKEYVYQKVLLSVNMVR
jgi:hypothetical protein